jgi:radical SAM superfamily enzyme YgiQ (UPF0313 family)
MRVVLADVKAAEGFVHKDTWGAGFGSRLRGFSTVTRWAAFLKKRVNGVPSVTLAYLAAILDQEGHDVRWSRGEMLDGDVALVLSSLVDHRNETRWADAMRKRGVKVGFIGPAASKVPELFEAHADFIVYGEPEEAVRRLARGEELLGFCGSQRVVDLASLPFPRWDLVGVSGARPSGGLTVLPGRGCPESCSHCPNRAASSYRRRAVANIADELAYLCERFGRPFVVFRDPLFTRERDQVLALCDEIRSRGVELRFECEARLDRLDEELLVRLRAAGLQTIEFGVESLSPETLAKLGGRPVPEAQQRSMIRACDRLGIRSVGSYVFGFGHDTWDSIAASIDYSIALGQTLAQFEVLTPYPGTPLWRHMERRVFEKDWERFDGFTPTFAHPKLSARELQFLLAAAYARFYLRPSFLANLYRIEKRWLRGVVDKLDTRVSEMHARQEVAAMSRAVEC